MIGSHLRGVGDTGADRQRSPPITEPPVLTCKEWASTRASGAPSTAWLEQVLAAERQFVMEMLTQRHEHLLFDLPAKLAAEAGAASVRGDREATKNEDVFAGAEGGKLLHQVGAIAPEPQTTRWGQQTIEESVESDDVEEVPLPGYVRSGTRAGTQSTTSDVDEDAATQKRLRREQSSLDQMKREIFTVDGLEEEDGGFLTRLVQSSRFELIVATIIMCNAIVLSYQIQYDGTDVGHQLGYRWYEDAAEEQWPGGEIAVEAMDYIFGICYIVELFLKVFAMKSQWLREPWNYLDALIVGLWLIEKPFKKTLALPADATILRTARLVRVLRLVKVLRALQGFDSLYLLLTTLRGSIWIFGWSGVLLLVTQMLIGMLFWFTLKEGYFLDESYDIDERKEVFEYFGTFSRAMLTMFEMTLANWPPVCRLLVRNYSEWFSLFCVFHKLTMGFAVIGVINGVFMQETFKVAATDDNIMIRHRDRDVKVHTAKMQRLFKAADVSMDGYIDKQEFQKIMHDKEIMLWLSSMDITVRDPHVLFALLDVNGDGFLSCEELVRGALALRGVARSADMLEMRAQVGMIKKRLNMHDFTSHHPLYMSTQVQSSSEDEASVPCQYQFGVQEFNRASTNMAVRDVSK